MDGMRMEFLYNAVGFSGWNICYEWMECGWNFRTDDMSGWKHWMEYLNGIELQNDYTYEYRMTYEVTYAVWNLFSAVWMETFYNYRMDGSEPFLA